MPRITTTERQASRFLLREDLRVRVEALAELLDAASDPALSFHRQSGVAYIDPHKGERARARLAAAIAAIRGDALQDIEPIVTPRSPKP